MRISAVSAAGTRQKLFDMEHQPPFQVQLPGCDIAFTVPALKTAATIHPPITAARTEIQQVHRIPGLSSLRCAAILRTCGAAGCSTSGAGKAALPVPMNRLAGRRTAMIVEFPRLKQLELKGYASGGAFFESRYRGIFRRRRIWHVLNICPGPSKRSVRRAAS